MYYIALVYDYQLGVCNLSYVFIVTTFGYMVFFTVLHYTLGCDLVFRYFWACSVAPLNELTPIFGIGLIFELTCHFFPST